MLIRAVRARTAWTIPCCRCNTDLSCQDWGFVKSPNDPRIASGNLEPSGRHREFKALKGPNEVIPGRFESSGRHPGLMESAGIETWSRLVSAYRGTGGSRVLAPAGAPGSGWRRPELQTRGDSYETTLWLPGGERNAASLRSGRGRAAAMRNATRARAAAAAWARLPARFVAPAPVRRSTPRSCRQSQRNRPGRWPGRQR